MIQVARHQRLNPATCPKLIANVHSAWDKNHDRETTIYKGYAYHVEDGQVWACYQGAVETAAFSEYTDKP